MPRFVALFRGINVGKAKRIAMADLRTLLESLGYLEVRTLLNSGNAIFEETDHERSNHAERIQAAVAEDFGFDAVVIVKSAEEIADVVSENRLGDVATDPSRLLVALTSNSNSLLSIESIAKKEWGSEMIHVGKSAAYVWCPNGILESTAAVALLKGLADSGTTRNWSTIQTINDLLQGTS